MPSRIQRRRIRGWLKPSGAVKTFGRAEAIRRYREILTTTPGLLDEARAELAGRDLACWCRLTDPCHADVLLELVNTP